MRVFDAHFLAAGDLILVDKGCDSRLNTFYGPDFPYALYVFDRFADVNGRALILRDAAGRESELSLDGDRYSLDHGASGNVSDVKHPTAKEAADFGLQGRLEFRKGLISRTGSSRFLTSGSTRKQAEKYSVPRILR